ncbi:MAG: type I methionyl aminopeptidase [Alicyclobacillaceae bacterium]|nr:type I methionyl aminopeptidase [Alicyclobacillaceae bacterium]
MIVSKSKAELEWMREAGRIVALAHQAVAKAVAPGITTRELDRIADEVIRKHGAVPSFKGYHGYPASICVSVNEELVHGIPGKRVLEEGDIVSIDIGASYHGYHGDAAVTLPVGKISDLARRLLEVTEAALYKGIEKAVVGNRLSDISHAVQVHVESHGFSVVRDYVGHGIGRDMHEDPQIPNFGPPGHGPRLKPGMTLAIEPMVNAGTYRVKTLPDNWTVVTEDGSLAAHFEHTIAVTEGEPEILTRL